MKYKKTSQPYVYRAIDKERYVDGFLAKVIRPNARLHKLYQIAKHGDDPKRALRAAVRSVEAFVREHPRMTRRQIAELNRSKRDRDLPVGVRRVRNKAKTKVYHYYEAAWSTRPYQQKKKRFSINRYGDAEALQMALSARAEGLASMKA